VRRTDKSGSQCGWVLDPLNLGQRDQRSPTEPQPSCGVLVLDRVGHSRRRGLPANGVETPIDALSALCQDQMMVERSASGYARWLLAAVMIASGLSVFTIVLAVVVGAPN
jgi:hypothetical protein